MSDVTPCRWCEGARGIVMIGEEDTGILLCLRCDFARPMNAGPPIDESRIRDTEPSP